VHLDSQIIGGLYLDIKRSVIEADFSSLNFLETLHIDSKRLNRIHCERFTIQLTTSRRRSDLLDIEYNNVDDAKLAIIISAFYYCRHVWES